jgi:hypothetical protein
LRRLRSPWWAALLCGLALGAAEPRRSASGHPLAAVEIGLRRIEVEVADTSARKTLGLSGRASLPDGHGMLFPYERPARQGFWMRDMRFDIDIVWIRAGRIVDITLRARHDVPQPPPLLYPSEPADLVLEVPAGTAERAGWRRGDPVRVVGWPPG